MTAHPLPRRPALAACGLWLAGAALAAFTGILSITHSQAGYAAVYAVVSAGLAGLAVGTYHAVRSAETVTLVLLGSQVLGVVGAAVELARGDGDGGKGRHLRELGLDFHLAVLGNLVDSAAASAGVHLGLDPDPPTTARHREGGQPPKLIGGQRLPQGLASSSWAATRTSRSSRP